VTARRGGRRAQVAGFERGSVVAKLNILRARDPDMERCLSAAALAQQLSALAADPASCLRDYPSLARARAAEVVGAPFWPAAEQLPPPPVTPVAADDLEPLIKPAESSGAADGAGAAPEATAPADADADAGAEDAWAGVAPRPVLSTEEGLVRRLRGLRADPLLLPPLAPTGAWEGWFLWAWRLTWRARRGALAREALEAAPRDGPSWEPAHGWQRWDFVVAAVRGAAPPTLSVGDVRDVICQVRPSRGCPATPHRAPPHVWCHLRLGTAAWLTPGGAAGRLGGVARGCAPAPDRCGRRAPRRALRRSRNALLGAPPRAAPRAPRARVAWV